MLLAVNQIRTLLFDFKFFFSGMAALSTLAFLGILLGSSMVEITLHAALAAACLGLPFDVYSTYRSRLGTRFAFFGYIYFFLFVQLMLVGAMAMFLAEFAGREEQRWLALAFNTLVMTASLGEGMHREARRLGVRGAGSSSDWKKKIERYIDYSKKHVQPWSAHSPVLFGSTRSTVFSVIAIAGLTIVAPIINAYYDVGGIEMFFIVPLFISGSAYLNFKLVGPNLLRLILLQKIEKSMGCKFSNANIEWVQRRRRHLLLARWLMKDYEPPRRSPSEEEEINYKAGKLKALLSLLIIVIVIFKAADMLDGLIEIVVVPLLLVFLLFWLVQLFGCGTNISVNSAGIEFRALPDRSEALSWEAFHSVHLWPCKAGPFICFVFRWPNLGHGRKAAALDAPFEKKRFLLGVYSVSSRQIVNELNEWAKWYREKEQPSGRLTCTAYKSFLRVQKWGKRRRK